MSTGNPDFDPGDLSAGGGTSAGGGMAEFLKLRGGRKRQGPAFSLADMTQRILARLWKSFPPEAAPSQQQLAIQRLLEHISNAGKRGQ